MLDKFTFNPFKFNRQALINLALIVALAFSITQPYFRSVSAVSAPQSTILFTRSVVAKAADYTIAVGDSGKIFTNRGATGTVVFTLPTASATYAGFYFEVVAIVAAQTVTITGATADTLITFNEVDADSVSLGTTNEIIGGGFYVFCDGTSWVAIPLTEETQTVTVAD